MKPSEKWRALAESLPRSGSASAPTVAPISDGAVSALEARVAELNNRLRTQEQELVTANDMALASVTDEMNQRLGALTKQLEDARRDLAEAELARDRANTALDTENKPNMSAAPAPALVAAGARIASLEADLAEAKKAPTPSAMPSTGEDPRVADLLDQLSRNEKLREEQAEVIGRMYTEIDGLRGENELAQEILSVVCVSGSL